MSTKKINMYTTIEEAAAKIAVEDEAISRIDVIGQNGNTGEHYDMVNHPPHYQSDSGIECIDAIRAALGKEGFISYCRGNAMKYIWRDKVNNVEDYKKAVWYLNAAIKAKEAEE